MTPTEPMTPEPARTGDVTLRLTLTALRGMLTSALSETEDMMACIRHSRVDVDSLDMLHAFLSSDMKECVKLARVLDAGFARYHKARDNATNKE